jgi:FkbM family methyltransferase
VSDHTAGDEESGWWQQSLANGINIFGAGGFARSIAAAAQARGVKVHAMLVSREAKGEFCDGIPVRRIDPQAIAAVPTWVAVFNREAHSNYSSLRAIMLAMNERANLIWPQEYYAFLQDALGWRFWLHALPAYADVEPEIQAARNLLEDDQSREIFDSLLEFRRAAAGWDSPVPSQDLQYLPTWLREFIKAPLRLVDAGAYRGETVRDLVAATQVEEGWTFEPDPENYSALVENLADMKLPLTHFPAALSAHAGVARFTVGHGEGSSLAPTGSSQVAQVALDKCLHGVSINFLKLDVEGHELEALRGAQIILRRDRPVLAVAGYHRWDDLWRIPFFIHELELGYRLRLGLHGHNSFDSVFYAY